MKKIITFSNEEISNKSEYDIFSKTLTTGFVEDHKEYLVLLPLFEKGFPVKFQLLGKKDFNISKGELNELKLAIEEYLSNLIKNKEEKPDGTPDTKNILGKNVFIFLKDPEDKIINTIARTLDAVNDCLTNNKPMYFYVSEYK